MNSDPNRRRPRLLSVTLWLAALAPLGCGAKDGHVPLFPTSGQVLVGDQPAAGAEVRFCDATAITNVDLPRPYATADAEGKFRLSTYEAGDGAPAGNYNIMILWPEGPPGPGVPRDRLRNTFTDPIKTTIKATIPEGGGKLEPFRIDPTQLKKPTPKVPDPLDAADPTRPG